jgi:hypothetical protein
MAGAVRKLCGVPAYRKIGRAPGSPGRGLAKPGRGWKVGSMDVAGPPGVEATVADTVRTPMVTRNYQSR